MYTASIKSVSYSPGEPPSDPDHLQGYLRSEFAKIGATFGLAAAGHMDPCHVEPEKPREGDYRYADGTDWNPGSGRGVYIYNGTAWVLWVSLP